MSHLKSCLRYDDAGRLATAKASRVGPAAISQGYGQSYSAKDPAWAAPAGASTGNPPGASMENLEVVTDVSGTTDYGYQGDRATTLSGAPEFGRQNPEGSDFKHLEGGPRSRRMSAKRILEARVSRELRILPTRSRSRGGRNPICAGTVGAAPRAFAINAALTRFDQLRPNSGAPSRPLRRRWRPRA